MKKENVFLMIMVVVSLFMFTGTVFAEKKDEVCPAIKLAELRSMASNVKVTYAPVTEIKEIPGDNETGATKYSSRVVVIKVYNMNTRLYLDVSNNEGYKQVVTADRALKDGTIGFKQEKLDRKINYTFDVKSTEYGCDTVVLRTIRVSIPMYNKYAELDICADIPEYYLCQEFVTAPVDGATFYDRVDAYKAKLLEQGQDIEEDNTSGVNKTFANASKYKYLIVGIIVALGVVITIVIIKRKENA